MSDLKKIIGDLDSGFIEFGLAVRRILEIDLTDRFSKLEKQVIFSAKEITHYYEQFTNAESPQWEASFRYELERSQNEFIKHIKKFSKNDSGK